MKRTLSIAVVALAVLVGCSRAKGVHGTWLGTYTPGDISPNDFDIVAHEEFAAVTHGNLTLVMKDGYEFELRTVGSVKGRWDIDGSTVTLIGKSAAGKDLPGVDLVLSKDGNTLNGKPEKDGTKLTFKKQP